MKVFFYFMHKEIGWLCSCGLIPFEAEYLSTDSKIPVLRAAKGTRFVFGLVLHILVTVRCLLLISVVEGRLQLIYKGNLTVDFCFIAANALLGLTMAVAWVRIWLNLDYYAWTCNTMNQVSRCFAGKLCSFNASAHPCFCDRTSK